MLTGAPRRRRAATTSPADPVVCRGRAAGADRRRRTRREPYRRDLAARQFTVNFDAKKACAKSMRTDRRCAPGSSLWPPRSGLLAGGCLPAAPRRRGADIVVNVNQGATQPLPIAIPAFTGAPVGGEIAAGGRRRPGALGPVPAARPGDLPERAAGRERPAAASPPGRRSTPRPWSTARLTVDADGRLNVDFRLWDVFAGSSSWACSSPPRRTTGAAWPTRSPTPSTRG